jgi:hypothetical protein
VNNDRTVVMRRVRPEAPTTVLRRVTAAPPDMPPARPAIPFALFGAALVVDATVLATLGGLVTPLAASTAAAAVLSTLAGFELFRLVGRWSA